MSHQPSKSNEEVVWGLYVDHLEDLMQEAEMAVRYEVKDKEAYYERLRVGSRALCDAIRTLLNAKDAEREKAVEEARRKGYDAGLADGTGNPLIAIEQMRERAVEDCIDKAWEYCVKCSRKESGSKEELREFITQPLSNDK